LSRFGLCLVAVGSCLVLSAPALSLAPFLAWTAARRLTPKLTVARQRADVPSRLLDEDQHLDLLRRRLAAELPAPVLATLIGLAPSTSDDWNRSARTDWSAYLAARAQGSV
jgi:hypothetical protein